MIENLEPVAGSERPLDEIRAELARLKQDEVTKKSKTAHFVPSGKYMSGGEIMIEDISDVELRLYDRLSRYPALGEVTREEIDSLAREADASGNTSRWLFKGLLGNIFLVKVEGPKHLEEMRKQQ